MRTGAGLQVTVLLIVAFTAGACASTAPSDGLSTPTGAAATLAPPEASTSAPTGAAAIPTTQASAVVTTDPCILITRDEAAGFLGSPVTDYKKSTSQALPGVKLTICTFTSAAGILTIGLARPFDWDVFLGAIPADVQKQLQPVSGLGDAAWFLGDPTKGVALLIRTGNAFVEVTVFVNSGTSTEDLEKQAGQLALTRL